MSVFIAGNKKREGKHPMIIEFLISFFIGVFCTIFFIVWMQNRNLIEGEK